MTTRDDIINALNHDGATYEDSSGRSWSLSIERDDVPPMEMINDVDCWGRLEWTDRDPNTGYDKRPAGFTGAAHKLNIYGYATEGTIWWEPPADVDPAAIPALKAEVTRLLEDGFVIVDVRVDGHAASLCGIDTVEDGYLAVIVAEHVDEILAEIESAAIDKVRSTFTLEDAIR